MGKKKTQDDLIDDIFSKTIGKDNPFATFLNNDTVSTVPGFISTGSYALNAILSGKFKDGGIPQNRLSLIAGESMTGKSYIAQRLIAEAQKIGKTVLIFDTESAIDGDGARKLGVDTSTVRYVPVFSIEDCRNWIYNFLTKAKEAGITNKFFIVVDSLGNLDSALELKRMEKGSDSMDMGSKARAMKSLLKTCTMLSALTQTTILMTNHTYDDPGALHPSIIKNMPGGKSVVFLPSVSVQLARKPVKEDKTDGDKLAAGQRAYPGVILRALTIKNRFVKQFLQTEMYLSFSKGLSPYFGLLKLAVELECIEQTGSTFVYKGKKMGYASKFATDKDFWENTLVPDMQAAVDKVWQYGSGEEDLELDISEDLDIPTSFDINDVKNLIKDDE
tara:strand:+ start:36400 stop:37566 length:1167 start_codon:yes stop_codon:yes gene_type:complete